MYPNNAIQATLYINQCIHYVQYLVLYITLHYTLYSYKLIPYINPLSFTLHYVCSRPPWSWTCNPAERDCMASYWITYMIFSFACMIPGKASMMVMALKAMAMACLSVCHWLDPNTWTSFYSIKNHNILCFLWRDKVTEKYWYDFKKPWKVNC